MLGVVQIDEQLNAKLFDFKFCTRIGEQCKPFGPVKVFAPEACLTLTSSIKADAYQLGYFFLSLVTRGNSPFPELTNRIVLEKRLSGVRLAPRIPRLTPAWLANLISSLTVQEPAARSSINMVYYALAGLSVSLFASAS